MAAIAAREWAGTTWRVARAVWTVSGRTHVGLIAAGVAFYGMFALFPGMAALIAVFGLISDPGVVRTELQLLHEVIPDQAFDLLSAQLERLLTASGTTLGWTTALSFAVALWSARAGVSAVVQGLNAIYDIPNRGGLRHEAVALAMTLALMAIAVTALLVVVVAPILIALVPPTPGTARVLQWLRWGAALVVLISGLGMVYRYGPNRTASGVVWMTPGAIVVVALWLAVSAGLSLYLSNFGAYNQVYGSIGAVIALLMWLYVSAYLVLMGAALNAVLERLGRAGQVRHAARGRRKDPGSAL